MIVRYILILLVVLPALSSFGALRYRIIVTSDGIYRVTGKQLAEAGADLSTLSKKLDFLRLESKGVEIPLYIVGEEDGSFDAGDYFEFYGEYNKKSFIQRAPDIYQDPYTLENIYILSWDGTQAVLQMVDESGANIEFNSAKYISPTSYNKRIHFEMDRIYVRLGANSATGLRDHWFWEAIESGTKKAVTLQIEKPHASFEPVEFKIMMSGNAYSNSTPLKHIAEVWFNNVFVGAADNTPWYNQNIYSLTVSKNSSKIINTSITDGDNLLEISLKSSGGRDDEILLNWVEIDYLRTYEAYENYIEFTKPDRFELGLYQFTIKGFTDPNITIYKRGRSKIKNATITRSVTPKGTFYAITFQDHIVDKKTMYIALTPGKINVPEKIELFEISDLKNKNHQGKYLIITHEDFWAESQAFAEYRKKDFGAEIVIAKIKNIYNEFNHGIAGPHALKDLIRYAYSNWQVRPEYVLLIGDGTWDKRKGSISYIPVYSEFTETWGVASSDNWYVTLDDNTIVPDMAIGRIPVRNNFQLRNVTDKIKHYEDKSAFDVWRKTVLFISGVGDPLKIYESDSLYKKQTQVLALNHISPPFDISYLHVIDETNINPVLEPTATDKLIGFLDKGSVITTFLGHGGGGVWSDENLFTLNDVGKLDNKDNLPFIISGTCFTSAFDDPTYTAMGEEALLRRDKGAIAFWGASGLGYVFKDIALIKKVYSVIFSENIKLIGDALRIGKLYYYNSVPSVDTTSAAWALIQQYNLLGDPALKLNIPTLLPITIDKLSTVKNDTLTITGKFPRFIKGDMTVSIVNKDKSFKQDTVYSLSGESYSVSIVLSSLKSAGNYFVTFYIQDVTKREDYMGFTQFSYEDLFISNISTSPQTISYKDSVRVYAKISSAHTIDSVFCIWYRARSTMLKNKLPMINNSKTLYTTTASIFPDSPDAKTLYYIKMFTDKGDVDSTSLHTYNVLLKPNLKIDSSDIFIQYTNVIKIGAVVANNKFRRVNNSGMSAESVFVQFFVNGSTALGNAIIPELLFAEKETVFISYNNPQLNDEIMVKVDPFNVIEEDMNDTINNSATKRFHLNIFTVLPADTTTATISNNNLVVELLPQSVDSPAVLFIENKKTSLDVSDQPDLVYVTVNNNSLLAQFELGFTQNNKLKQTFKMSFGFEKADIDTNLSIGIFKRDSISDNWVRMALIDSQATQLRTVSSEMGIFALLQYSDKVPPSVNITVEDQTFTSGSYVNAYPTIAAVLQDENGVDVSPGRIMLFFDNIAQPLQIDLPYNSSANNVPVRFKPSTALQPGQHSVSIQAYDCVGNLLSSKSVTLNRVDEFRIEKIGTYPSPFKNKTVFIFKLTNRPDELSLKIYTRSGRLIKTFAGIEIASNTIDLYDILWEGKDDWNNQIANGVYFYKITAKRGDEVINYKGKVVRFR